MIFEIAFAYRQEGKMILVLNRTALDPELQYIAEAGNAEKAIRQLQDWTTAGQPPVTFKEGGISWAS